MDFIYLHRSPTANCVRDGQKNRRPGFALHRYDSVGLMAAGKPRCDMQMVSGTQPQTFPLCPAMPGISTRAADTRRQDAPREERTALRRRFSRSARGPGAPQGPGGERSRNVPSRRAEAAGELRAEPRAEGCLPFPSRAIASRSSFPAAKAVVPVCYSHTRSHTEFPTGSSPHLKKTRTRKINVTRG